MTALPKPVRELLQAVVDAVDLPLPDITEQDDRERTLLLDRRAAHVAIILGLVLRDGGTTIADLTADAAHLRKYTAGPLTYTPWQAPRDRGTS
ncbi:hypothetical protein [Streptomyces sp. H27-C3]|uniref:hypothetical protein n=1 Tax=Streptomyces sp. H27-C3 TaxID=3046305 RepID=UPI0024B88F39|nr:hypothetical protein [Streptomyces sp. H27-C3]MDJ0461577.1 hypothetical protein [Streptomyces sp. H27-C3]